MPDCLYLFHSGAKKKKVQVSFGNKTFHLRVFLQPATGNSKLSSYINWYHYTSRTSLKNNIFGPLTCNLLLLEKE